MRRPTLSVEVSIPLAGALDWKKGENEQITCIHHSLLLDYRSSMASCLLHMQPGFLIMMDRLLQWGNHSKYFLKLIQHQQLHK